MIGSISSYSTAQIGNAAAFKAASATDPISDATESSGTSGTQGGSGCVAISGSGKVWYGRFSQKPHQKYPLQGS